MAFSDDNRVSGVSSPVPYPPSSFVPILPVKNVWSLSSNNHFEDIKVSREPILPHEHIYRYCEKNLNIRYTLPGYDRPPIKVEGTTTQLKWQVSAADSSFKILGERSPTENVWDMLVGLLGSANDKKTIRTTERFSTSTSNKRELLINSKTICSQVNSRRKNFSAKDNPTTDESRMLVPHEGFHPHKKQSNFDGEKSKGKGKQRGKHTKKKSEKVIQRKRCKSNLPKSSQVLELPKGILKHKPQEGTFLVYPGESFVQDAKKEHSIQDSMLQVSKTLDRASQKESTSLTTEDFRGSQDIIMWTMKFLNPLSNHGRLHPVLMCSPEFDCGFFDTIVIRLNVYPNLSDKEHNFATKKKTFASKELGNINQSQCNAELFMSGQISELPNIISKLSNTKMSKSIEFGEDIGKANAIEFLINESNHLRENYHSPEFSNILPKFSQAKVKELWKTEDATKVNDFFANASEYSEEKESKIGTTSVCDARKLTGHQVDLVSFLPSDRSPQSQEGWNVKSSALSYPSGIQQNSNVSATAVGDHLPPKEQLKLLLHASYCQLLKVCLRDESDFAVAHQEEKLHRH